MSTSPVMSLDGEKNIAQSALINRENVLRVLGNFSTSLEKIKKAIQDGDAESLQKQMTQAIENRQEWIRDRKENTWISIENQVPLPTAGEVLSRLVTFGRPKQTPPKNRKK